ncbi:ubiquinone/menaquinone biosynthesis C-methyltransferase UbiE [Oxobacter pfennigii]|uniref:Ubiquinone/menaquinone biosynthesis C-methyltransferase UbiE n=1 Tax=Oxobacter pfennigii TaxID=36849 RepID=A0A0P8WJM3_9CLOT|nr:methyltransferase domain-containing protein [Oxobacter pfennigii]KPU42357.1 ubiquinone/menaquinone biosynthesis C-methyltransferase UbiE [Oxobacter pfennigii]
MEQNLENQIKKLESPERIAELKPKETLLKAGLTAGMAVADIGAGSGIFSFAAAEITNETIYALEVNIKMLEFIDAKCRESKINNICTVEINGDNINLPAYSVDMVIMSNVLHNIENKALEFNEVNRILKNNGRLLLIEWKRKRTDNGPHFEKRIDKKEAVFLGSGAGFSVTDEMEFGKNLYGIVFRKM